jgi:cell division protein FtsI (penicillin-binding protein 3)
MARPQWRVGDVRLALIGFVFVLIWVGIGFRLVDVQALNADAYAERGFDQRVRREALPSIRGSVLDREYNAIATTVDALVVLADPTLVTDDAEAARLLAPMVDKPEEDLAEAFASDGRYYVVQRGLTGTDADEVREFVRANEIEGIFFATEPKRIYPFGALASQLVGFVRVDDGTGLEGLEYRYDELLGGEPGQQIIERDPYGNPIPQGQYIVDPPLHGSDLVLTVDSEIQFAAEEALTDALVDTGATSGTVVVLDVETGGVLAMANAPSFDPNDRRFVESSVFRNGAVGAVYEPGSTLKVVTIAAAIEEGIVEPSTVFDVPAEYVIPLEPEPKVYEDVGHDETEEMSVGEIVARSSNVGTIIIQALLGNELHHQYLSAFGLGRATGEFPAESAGSLEDASDWCASTCGPSTAIGYRVGVTPLQMASVFAAIANDGVWMQPHVVDAIVHPDLTVDEYEPVSRPVVSAETAKIMQRLLMGVVVSDNGTGWRAAVDGYTVGGKTGTTEKYLPDEGAYSETDRIASFIGMAPITDPRIVVAVVLDSPSGEDEDGADLKFGGVSAAPVFAAVTQAALHDLGVPPDAP